MTATDVITLYTELENLNIKIWVDGGWGVDALIGEQTRPHKDFDIAIQQKDVTRLRQLLHKQGYREIKLQEARPWNFVLGDQNGREIDVQVIVIDEREDGIYGPPENGEMYPAASLTDFRYGTFLSIDRAPPSLCSRRLAADWTLPGWRGLPAGTRPGLPKPTLPMMELALLKPVRSVTASSARSKPPSPAPAR